MIARNARRLVFSGIPACRRGSRAALDLVNALAHRQRVAVKLLSSHPTRTPATAETWGIEVAAIAARPPFSLSLAAIAKYAMRFAVTSIRE